MNAAGSFTMRRRRWRSFAAGFDTALRAALKVRPGEP
jgi:hypothetical protein